MKQAEYVRWVEQAGQGDLDAFTRLVQHFQGPATATAFGWLGDMESARDVCQEAFLDAYAHLSELREPAAFPGWLRRIVIKHCDRITRRRSATLEPLDPEFADTAAPLEDQVRQAQRASGLRLAVGSLPPPERIVIALTYFAGLSGSESAQFLELPLSTIKKRLRSARERLRAQGEDIMIESLNQLRPPPSDKFTDVVTFFLAVRQGDHHRVADLLRSNPGLVDAVQDWDPDLVTKGVLPFASKATALITAIERDDMTLLQLLLDAGADVNGRCECATGESPVWAATLLDRPAHLRTLLELGADADQASQAGTFPLHVAAMRGHLEMARLLLENGADPQVADRHGHYPEHWARSNCHAALADLLAASPTRENAQSDPSRAKPAQQSLTPILHTGIKAVDLFCPLPRGGLVRVPFLAGVGMVVLMGELCERITRTPSGRALWTGFAQRPFDATDWRTDMSELGILDRVEHYLAELDASIETRRDTFNDGISRALELRQQGSDVIMVLLCDHGFEADVESAFPGLLEPTTRGSITTLLITPFPQTEDATWPQPQQPFTAQLRLDRKLAKRGLFPAVHPTLSWSRALSDSGVGVEHLRVADAARTLLANYAATDPEFAAIEKAAITDPRFASQERTINTNTTDERERAIALLHYLTQPFFVAEPFTGRQGQWVDQQTLLTDVDAIVSG